MEVQSVAKAMRLLMTLASGPAVQTVSSLARDLNMDKSSVSRLLRTLEAEGFVEQDAASRGYTLGPTLVHLGQTVLRRLDLRSLARPALEDLAHETAECTHLATLSNARALYVDQASPPSGVNVDAPVGTLAPLHCTALGKALLAFQARDRREALLETLEFRAYTRRTIRDVDQLRANIRQVVEQGVAVDDEEFSVGVRCLAAPVFDHAGAVVGAIGISGPSPRITDDRMYEWGERVRDHAREVSQRLGWRAEDERVASGVAGE